VLNPLGRTPGSKDFISRAFLTDLQAAWVRHGPKVLDWLARKDRRTFAMLAAAMVPKDFRIDETQRVYVIRDTPLSVEEWQLKHAGGVPIPEPDEPTH
jgi:hypothetical protein